MKKILLMVAVLMMTAISMKAQTAGERSILTVNLKDGSKVQFELPVQLLKKIRFCSVATTVGMTGIYLQTWLMILPLMGNCCQV